MGYANGKQPVSGCFREKEFKKEFEFIDRVDEWGAKIGATHTVYTGCFSEERYAKVLKTVAYICVDEDENCQPVWEKWFIKTLWNHN